MCTTVNIKCVLLFAITCRNALCFADLKGKKVMVTHEYKAAQPDELNLTPGQV